MKALANRSGLSQPFLSQIEETPEPCRACSHCIGLPSHSIRQRIEGTGSGAGTHDARRVVRPLLEGGCSEVQGEIAIFRGVHGERPVKWLHQHGLLDRHASLAHRVWLDDAEVELVATSGATIVHNPVSNQYIASGTLRMTDLVDAGANVALGTDGLAVTGQSLFEAMKSGLLLQRVAHLDPTRSTAERLLEFATRNGGATVGGGGSLAEGQLADITVLDVSGLHHRPLNRPATNAVFAARPSDVRWVVVDGELVVDEHRPTRVNADEILAELERVTPSVLAAAGLESLRFPWIH